MESIQRRFSFNIHLAAFWVLSGLLVMLSSDKSAALAASPPPAEESATQDPAAPASATTAWFREIAVESGLDFKHVRAQAQRLWFPEIMSGGGCLIDFDGDGWLDIYLVQGGDLDAETPNRPGNRLFRNLGKKNARLAFEDATAKPKTGNSAYGMGCAVGDIDGDGDIDLYVTNVGPNTLYRNNGDGTFTDVSTQAGVDNASWGSSAVFFDAEADGDLDLYLVNYVNWAPNREIECYSGGKTRDYCHPDNYNSPAPDVFYRNNGDGTFIDASLESGLRRAVGNGLGVTAADWNGDGKVDLYVANDGDPNQLWINQGGGKFTDEALMSGSAVNRYGLAEAGMGIAAADLEADGDIDLFLTHLRDESNTLYLQQNGLFEDMTVSADLSASSISYTGFGTGFADFDHDGQLDLLVVNGRVGLGLEAAGNDPYAEPNILWRGAGGGKFSRVAEKEAFAEASTENSRAAVFGDLDNDGDVDVLVVNNGERARLLENLAGERGGWIMFRPLDTGSRLVYDAQVRIDAGGTRQARLAQPAYSYLASNDPRVHFGIGNAKTIARVEVIWPGGKTEIFGPFDAGSVYDLRRGQGRAVK